MSRQKRTRAAQLSTPVSLLYTCPYKLTPLTRCHGHRKLNFTTTIDVIVARRGKDIDSLDIVCRDGDQIKRMESVYLPERTKVTAFDISPLSVFDVHYPLEPHCAAHGPLKSVKYPVLLSDGLPFYARVTFSFWSQWSQLISNDCYDSYALSVRLVRPVYCYFQAPLYSLLKNATENITRMNIVIIISIAWYVQRHT